MYEIDIKKKVMKFIESLEFKETIIYKLKELKQFKSGRKLRLDIERLKGTTKCQEFYRLRVGEVRFIFQVLKKERILYIKSADYRGKVYN
ncbi:MAG: type II toxin-antitoxin system RelE family toxin [Nanoarchaeota archaeon]